MGKNSTIEHVTFDKAISFLKKVGAVRVVRLSHVEDNYL